MTVAQLVELTSLMVKDQNAGIKVKPMVRVHPVILHFNKISEYLNMQKETSFSLEKAMKEGLEFRQLDWLPDFFHQDLNISYLADIEAIKQKLSVAEILNYYFDSDEEVTANVYAYENIPFLLYEKYGDRTNHNITSINKEVWKKLATDVFMESLDIMHDHLYGDEEKVEDIKIAKLENQHYVNFSDSEKNDNFSVHILSPKWQMGFKYMFSTHKAQYQDKNVEFVRFENNKPSWESDSSGVVVIMEGEEVIVLGEDINFVIQNKAKN